MAGKVQERRKALRESLTLIAQRHIAQNGLGALRARDLAKEAGCALGAIYNVFGDLTDLVLEVNARTFKQLGADVAEALASADQTPLDQLTTMGQAYAHFAADHPHLWRALFDVDRPDGETAPDWYLAEMGRLLAYIDAPLRVAFRDMSDVERDLFTRTLFSSVHGIVLLGLENASAGVPTGQVDQMIALLLKRLVPAE